MINKNEFIKSVEHKEGVFSYIELPFLKGEVMKHLNSKKIKIVFEKTSMQVFGKLITEELVLETAQKFLIHLKNDNSPATIYYKPEQQKELLFFINQNFKGYKNDTINN